MLPTVERIAYGVETALLNPKGWVVRMDANGMVRMDASLERRTHRMFHAPGLATGAWLLDGEGFLVRMNRHLSTVDGSLREL